jgi:hypothetical protein
LPDAQLFNAVGAAKDDEQAFEWLLNRINRTMHSWETGAILICDQGKELAYRRLRRRMGVHNPIPSMFGFWAESGGLTKNIPLDRVVEDLVFKDSRQSYFIQPCRLLRLRAAAKKAAPRLEEQVWPASSVRPSRADHRQRLQPPSSAGSNPPTSAALKEEAGPTPATKDGFGPAPPL